VVVVVPVRLLTRVGLVVVARPPRLLLFQAQLVLQVRVETAGTVALIVATIPVVVAVVHRPLVVTERLRLPVMVATE